MKPLALMVTLSASLSGVAAAQAVISTQSIIVNPVPSNVQVRVWTDRDSSGTRVPDYLPGERIRLYTSVAQDAYVYLFNVDPNGQVDLILPNRYQSGGNFLRAGSVRVFPSAGDPFTFDIAAPYGVNKVLALASRAPLNIDQIARFSAQQGFASVSVQGQQGLAQALSIVVNPVPQNTWDSATAFYRVVSARAAAPVQNSPVRTNPVQVNPVQVNPVQPAPVAVNPPRTDPPRTVQPLSVNVTPAGPWGNAREWKTSVPLRDLRQVHAEYAARLRAEGYVVTDTDVKNNEIKSEYRRTGGGKAELSVKRKGNRLEIKVERK